MRRGVPANRQQTEIVGRAPIERGDPRTDVVAVFINGSSRRPSIARRYRLGKGPRRVGKALFWVHRNAGGVVGRAGGEVFREQHFLRLLGDWQFVGGGS